MNDRTGVFQNSSLDCRRAIRHLRSGTASPLAARLITAGTQAIEAEVLTHKHAWQHSKTPKSMMLVSGDWGFGKTHLRMLLVDALLTRGMPLVQDDVDGKSGSLAHLHRAVPRWIESIQLGERFGLRSIVQKDLPTLENALKWSSVRTSVFSRHLSGGIAGSEWAWAFAAGHQYQFPEYSYNHLRALELVQECASLMRRLSGYGITLLLDEAENVSRQYDVRGRRKTYDSLGRLAEDKNIFSLVFVTQRFFEQVQDDLQRANNEGWNLWTKPAQHFVVNARGLPIIHPPRIDIELARLIVDRISELYVQAFTCIVEEELKKRIISSWRQTATKSARLLVRMAIDAFDRSIP